MKNNVSTILKGLLKGFCCVCGAERYQMKAKYFLTCLENYTVVLPATYLIDHNGNRISGDIPERRIEYTKDQRVTFGTKHQLGMFLRSSENVGKWCAG